MSCVIYLFIWCRYSLLPIFIFKARAWRKRCSCTLG